MDRNEKSRPLVAQEAGQAENAAGRAAFSDIDCNTDGPRRQRISSFLGRGKSSAVTGKELAGRLGLGDLREVSRLVEKERNAFVPICATCDPSNPGYFLPADIAELSEYNKILIRRIKAVSRTQKAIEAALEKMGGQEILGGWNDG